MSFEILEEATTEYAPLNTTIDADRDYRDLAGLDACGCGGGPPPELGGFYQGDVLPPGMSDGDLEGLPGGGMVWLVGGLLAGWAIWAMNTKHEEYRY